jgi:hypothetical protein
MGSAGSGNFIELYEVTSGNVWTPKPDAASKYLTGDLNNGCRVRLTYDGTDITVDYYNGSTWTNGVINVDQWCHHLDAGCRQHNGHAGDR